MNDWSEEEHQFFVENYPYKKSSEIADKLNRTISSVHSRACKFKIKKKVVFAWGTSCRFWTENEIKKLREVYPDTDTDTVVKIFNRTPEAIRQVANKLKIKKRMRGKHYVYWTKEEEKFILKNYQNHSMKELANKLDRSYVSVTNKVYTMGLEKKQPKISKARKEMGWKGTPAPNNEGERIAEKKFTELGWKIIDRGDSRTPFDYIIERDGKQYAIDVKYGYGANINMGSLKRMPKGYKIAYFFITKGGDTYFVPVEAIS